jgi:hypothetical protein
VIGTIPNAGQAKAGTVGKNLFTVICCLNVRPETHQRMLSIPLMAQFVQAFPQREKKLWEMGERLHEAEERCGLYQLDYTRTLDRLTTPAIR